MDSWINRLGLCLLGFLTIATAARSEESDRDHYDWVASNGSLLRFEEVYGSLDAARREDLPKFKDFSNWRPGDREPLPGHLQIPVSKVRIFCLEACAGLQPFELPFALVTYDDVIEFDGILIVSSDNLFLPSDKGKGEESFLEGFDVKDGKITSVFCARADNRESIILVGKRYSRLIFRFTGSALKARQKRQRQPWRKGAPIDHFLDLKTMRWENQGDDPHFCESY